MRFFIALGTLFAALHSALSERLNVHIIAHTHDDPGWLKTADEYYYGSNKQENKCVFTL